MKNITTYFFLFFPLLLSAQVVTVSDEISIRNDQAYYILDDQRGNVLLFRDKDTEFEVHGFNERMQKQWDKSIELDKKRPEIIDVVSFGGDFCVFYAFREKQDLILKAHRYNPAANLVDSVTIVNLGNVFYKPNFLTDYSEDKKTAVIWSVDNENEISALAFHIGRMKLLWNKTFEPDGLVFNRDFHQSIVDNAGNFYFILRKENRKAKQSEHRLEVLEMGGQGEEAIVRSYSVPMQAYLTYDAFFSFDNLNQKLLAGGLYSTDNLTRAEGLFFLSIDHSDIDQQVLVFHPFDKDFVNVLLEKEKTKNKGLTEVSVQDIVLRRDGGIILIGELNKEFLRGGGTTAYYARTGIRPIIDYYYDDVFLISIHPDGAIHWRDILHKKQYSQDDDAAYSSYFLAKTPAALRVVFNDEIKQESTVSEYIIRGDGQYDRKAVMNTERKELSLRFRDAVQISATEFVVPSERRSKLKLVRVRY